MRLDFPAVVACPEGLGVEHLNGFAVDLDLEILSRLQFALTIMFHYLFPPLTIGLGMLMVWAEGRWLRTGDPLYESIAFFWTRLFAVP